MIPKPPRSLLLLLLSRLPRSPCTWLAVTVVQPPFQKFLHSPLSSSCKRNKSRLCSSTLRFSHPSCERREHFSPSELGFRSSTWSGSLVWRPTLTLLLFCLYWCIFQQIQSRGLLRIYHTKQLNRHGKRTILWNTYAFVISKKGVKSFEFSKVDIMANLHRSLKVARNLHHS